MQPGSTVGIYRIEREISVGSFGQVWQARSMQDGSVVALKLVSLTQDREIVAAEQLGAQLQQRFQREHDLVPRVFEPGQDDHYFYIPMELVEGPSFADLIRQGPMAPEVAARHAMALCRFLEKAHSFATVIDGTPYDRIIHADLKPVHVLVTGPDTIKVLDFGISKALEKARSARTVKFVTPHYASAERLRTGRTNEHDDMWAVGVMLYEMVSGHRPYANFEDPPYFSRLRQAIESYEPRTPLPDATPPALKAIVHKLLNGQVEQRYQSAAAIREDLGAFVVGTPPRALQEFVTAPTIAAPRTESMPEPVRVRRPVPPTLPDIGPMPAPAPVPIQVDRRFPPRPPSLFGAMRLVVRRSVQVTVLLMLTSVLVRESAAWMGAERMRATLGTLDGRVVAERHRDYQRLQRWSVLHFGTRRLNAPLRERLVSLADDVIVDYRREEPAVALPQWQQATEALRWARELAPRDRRIRARELLCEAHLERIGAQNWLRANAKLPGAEGIARQRYTAALEKFDEAARLNDASFDPYLGMSRIYIYGLKNVDAGASAIQEAEKRGYTSGPRERASLGDGHLSRADASRRTARQLSGDQRRRTLESARADYDRCIQFFDPIVGFGNAADRLELCKRRLAAIDQELDVVTALSALTIPQF